MNTITHGRTVATLDNAAVYQVHRDGCHLGEIHLGRRDGGWHYRGELPIEQPENGWSFLGMLVAMIDMVAKTYVTIPPLVEEAGSNGTYRIFRDGDQFRGVCSPIDGAFWTKRSANLDWLIRCGRSYAGVRVGTPLPEGL